MSTKNKIKQFEIEMKKAIEEISKVLYIDRNSLGGIEYVALNGGQYDRNIIALSLSILSKKTNDSCVNKVIEDLDLESIGWEKV